jgi:uncharacterized protein (DUF927 family)
LNTTESALKEIEKIEKAPEAGYITLLDGKTFREKTKFKVSKKDQFFADFRTIDLVREIEGGNYGKEFDFIKYTIVLRKENFDKELHKNIEKDLMNEEFAEKAKKIYGKMALISLLKNLNDSLALSQMFKSPVAVDAIHAPLLRVKTKHEMGTDFAILDRLSQLEIPDFGDFDIDSLLQLRKEKSVRDFRNWIQKISTKLQSDHTLEIDRLVFTELLKEIKEIAPNKKGVCIEAFLGTISSLPVPIVGQIATIADVGKELKKYDDFSRSWLSFILKSVKMEK